MKDFKKLKVWQKSIDLVKIIYQNTKKFPKEEIFGLTSQIRRSAISIPSNIAEGSGRGTDKELNRFLNIAKGSSFELETQLIISLELDYISKNTFDKINLLSEEVQKMLAGLQKNLN